MSLLKILTGQVVYEPPVKEPDPPEAPFLITDRGETRRTQILHQLMMRPQTTADLAAAVNMTEQGIGRHLRRLAEWGVIDKETYGNGARTRWKIKVN